MMPAPPARPGNVWGMMAVALFIALIHGAWWFLGDTIVQAGGLADGDSFTHLIRAERLWMTGDWYDVTIPSANAPYGTTVHWTRLFDIVLLGLTVTFLPFMGFADALFLAGAAISPLLHVLLGLVLVWAVRPMFGPAMALIAGGLTATQFGILAFAIAGRADHHMLFILFAATAIGFLVRAEAEPEETAAGMGAGAALAAGVWVGPEFLLFTVISFVSFGLLWVFGRHQAATANRAVARGYAASLLIMVAIERGPGFAFPEFDRLSIIHLCMGLAILLIWEVIAYTAARRRGPDAAASRFVVLTVAACGAAMALIGLFPSVLNNPLTRENPEIVPIFAYISEYGAVADTAQFLIYFGSILFIGPWMVRRLWEAWRDRITAIWFIIAVAVVVYAAMGVGWLRWSMYAALFMAIFLADLIGRMDSILDRRLRLPWRIPVKVLVLAGLIIGPLGVAGTLRYADPDSRDAAHGEGETCRIADLAAVLNRPPWSDRPRVIVASANFGPELSYRTGHGAVATVHHRNIPGILDGHRILAGGDAARVAQILAARQVDLIVLCPGSRHDGYFVNGSPPDSLYQRLEQGPLPEGFVEVPLPNAAGDLRMFARH